MKEKMLTELRRLGFSDKESRVYLASMQLGPASMQKISKVAGVNRATTYVLVESLISSGLMSSVTKGKKRFFTAEDPAKLQHILRKEQLDLEDKTAALKQVYPELNDLFETTHGTDKPRVKFYQGKEGLLTARDEISKAKNKTIYSLFNADYMQEAFSEDEQRAFTTRRMKKSLDAHSVYSSANGEILKDDRAKNVDYTFIPYKEYNAPIEVTVFDDKTLISSLTKPLMGVMIQNENIAESFRQTLKILEKIPQASEAKAVASSKKSQKDQKTSKKQKK